MLPAGRVSGFHLKNTATRHRRHNVFGNTANAVNLSYFAYQLSARPFKHNLPLMLAVAACAYFLINTVPVAVVISLTEGKPLRSIWAQCYFWSFPYYLAGAALVRDGIPGNPG